MLTFFFLSKYDVSRCTEIIFSLCDDTAPSASEHSKLCNLIKLKLNQYVSSCLVDIPLSGMFRFFYNLTVHLDKSYNSDINFEILLDSKQFARKIEWPYNSGSEPISFIGFITPALKSGPPVLLSLEKHIVG